MALLTRRCIARLAPNQGDGRSFMAQVVGVGTALLQLGALIDLEMYGTAASDNHPVVSNLGAHPIDYKQVEFVEEITRLTEGAGVDIVFDGIGGTHVPRSYWTLRGHRFWARHLAHQQDPDGRATQLLHWTPYSGGPNHQARPHL